MRITVVVGDTRLRVPCDDTQTVGWLQAEIIRRWESKYLDTLRILELRSAISNATLDPDDQLFDVLKEDEVVVAILKQSKEEIKVGDMLAHRYYLQRLVGEGTYGYVYAAKDLNLNRVIAIKVLKVNKANQVNTRRFMREAQVTAGLSSHPNIVKVYDFGRTESGSFYLVMELLKGHTVDEVLDERIEKEQPITEAECVSLFIPVLDGLEAAHNHDPPIIHRDLKPDNIFLAEQGNSIVPVIMDFGIAILGEASKKTIACGTRMYSSPEQTRHGANLDCRSDVWSCGVILYQCVSLLVDVPFDPVEITLGTATVPHISKYTRTPLSQGFMDIITKALQKDPKDRFASAREMRIAMQQLQAGQNLDPVKGLSSFRLLDKPKPTSRTNGESGSSSTGNAQQQSQPQSQSQPQAQPQAPVSLSSSSSLDTSITEVKISIATTTKSSSTEPPEPALVSMSPTATNPVVLALKSSTSIGKQGSEFALHPTPTDARSLIKNGKMKKRRVSFSSKL